MRVVYISTRGVSYVCFRPLEGTNPNVDMLLLPNFLRNFNTPDEYIEMVRNLRIINPGSPSYKAIVVDKEATLEERARIIARSPRIMCFGETERVPYVKSNGNGRLRYKRFKGEIVRPESADDYVFGLLTVFNYLGTQSGEDSLKTLNDLGVTVFSAECHKEGIPDLTNNRQAALLKELNRAMKGRRRHK